MLRTAAVIWLTLMCWGTASALEPDEILVIANSEVPSSVRIAQYYCQARGVPADNLIAWPLGAGLNTWISRQDYERRLAEPLRSRLTGAKYAGKIKCLLTTYGVPMIVGYKVSLATYLLGKLLIRVDRVALPNIIAGKEVVPELIQNNLKPDRMARELVSLLQDTKSRMRQKDELHKITELLGEKGASRRAAAAVSRFFDSMLAAPGSE